MSYKSPLINVMQTACLKINSRILRDFGEIENLQNSDTKLERFFNKTKEYVSYNLKDYLKHCRPDWEFSETININNSNDHYYWSLKTFDGIENFKRSIPFFSISISVIHNDEVIACSIFDPLRDQFYFAEKGKGAFLNDHRIRVSSRKELNSSLISIQTNKEKHDYEKIFFKNYISIKNLRLINSTGISISWVCSGKIDCFVGINLNNNIVRNGMLLLRESGGFFLNSKINDDEIFLCANPIIHKKIIKILN